MTTYLKIIINKDPVTKNIRYQLRDDMLGWTKTPIIITEDHLEFMNKLRDIISWETKKNLK